MIPRYSLPKMSAVWQDESKFQKFLDIEILACEAHSKLKRFLKRRQLKSAKKPGLTCGA